MTHPARTRHRHRPGRFVGRFDAEIKGLCRIFDPSFSLRTRKEQASFLRQVAEGFKANRDNNEVSNTFELDSTEWNQLNTLLNAMGFFKGITLPENVTPQQTVLLGDALPSMRRMLAFRPDDDVISCIGSSRPTAGDIDGTPADIKKLVAEFADTRWFEWVNDPVARAPLETEYGLSSLAAIASGGDYDLVDAFPGRTTDWENPAEFYTMLRGVETGRMFTSYQMPQVAPTIHERLEYLLRLVGDGYIRLESDDNLVIVTDPVVAFRTRWASRQVANALPDYNVYVCAPSAVSSRETLIQAIEEVAHLLIAAS